MVGSPDIVDALPMSDRALYIQGKKVGTTNVSVFDQSMQLIGVIDVEVALDTGNLQEKIRASTGSSGIRVGSSNGQIVLSGVAGNAVAADRAVEVAKSMVPEGGTIVNAMKVAPAQQVMLKVRFLEVARTASREIGVNWFGANNGGNRGFRTGLGTSSAGGRPAVGPPGSAGCGTPPFVDAGGNPVPAPRFARWQRGTWPSDIQYRGDFALWCGALWRRAGQSRHQGGQHRCYSDRTWKRRASSAAWPSRTWLRSPVTPRPFWRAANFRCLSAQPGSAGGVPVITIQYKPFGVQLTFEPTVLANGIINLRLAPSVSELDFAKAVKISGFIIPSLTKREARTTVELRDGQSFAIAGLLQAINRRNIYQLPWIGSVPVLGALFRSASYQQEETDLVVIVTPHLVAPSVPGQQLASPLDNYIPTNDVDFFLMGQMEQRKKFRDYITSGGDIQGPYGHMIRSGPALPAISAPPISTKN